MKASSMIAGAFTPTRITTKPRLAARLYAGAVDDMPTTTLEISPSAPPLSPLDSTLPRPDSDTCVMTDLPAPVADLSVTPGLVMR